MPKERPSPADGDDVLRSPGYLLMKAGHYIGIEFDAVLTSLGLSAREFLVLSFARTSATLSQQELAARLGLDPTIVVGLVDGLEQRDLLKRSKHPDDRRRNVLALTPAGVRAHDRATAAAVDAQQRFLEPLSADERTALQRTLLAVLTPRLPWLC